MRGIAGELQFNNAAGPKADWYFMSTLMTCRGPDDEGILTNRGSVLWCFVEEPS